MDNKPKKTRPKKTRPKKTRPTHHAEDFGLSPLDNDDEMFKWFLLAYMLGKPIQSTVAVRTWQVFIESRLDNPWTISQASDGQLVGRLHEGGYTRYQHVMARSLHICTEQLLRLYDGSLQYMLSLASDEDEFSKLLQNLHGVGPKTAEIFMRETTEHFARRAE